MTTTESLKAITLIHQKKNIHQHTDVIKGGNDLNKSKKSYPKVAGGDNPMALASKIKEELSTLYKEYTGKDVVKEGGVKDMMQDVEEGMGKAEFAKKYPGSRLRQDQTRY